MTFVALKKREYVTHIHTFESNYCDIRRIKGAFTLGVRHSRVESLNTMLAI
jgi:hypothetical protein